jgi:hypothetical protein
MKTAPMKMFTSWPLGLRMLRRGRLCLTLSRIPKQAGAELREMLESVGERQ